MRIPNSTYRIQFNPDFGFQKAGEIVGYLSELGVSDLYASPIFHARKGSVHGYDVVDPTRINPELGTEEDFKALVSEVKEHGMGWLQDVVPNHMAFDSENRMLMDVMEHGEFSEFYSFFDIEWDHAYESMKGRLLTPFLGKPYGQSLEQGDITVCYGEPGFAVGYFGSKFPLRIESYPKILAPHLNTLKRKLGADHPDFIKLVGLLSIIKGLTGQDLVTERSNQVRFAKRMLWELYEGSDEIRAFMDKNLQQLNGGGNRKNPYLLDELLYDQFFRLAFWKVASEEINYRRFFSINELISLRMEDKNVFRRCHEFILKMIEEGTFTGLRIDHIDGLYDPLQYLERLNEKTGGAYITVEKILALDEDLPSSWPVCGTTGYEFMNYLNGIFCQKKNERAFDRIYSAFLGSKMDYENLVYDKKQIIIERFMTGDVDNLAHLMKRISSRDPGGCDITLYGFRRAIHEVLSCFPVYRTYISPDSFTETDRQYIEEAFDLAKRKNPDLLNELDYLNKFLLLEFEDYLADKEKMDWRHFVMRFQQFTGPLMAKGFEDTTLYVYNRLISLNEVGGEPVLFGISLDRFHDYNKQRAERWPHAMSSTSTHDTKRGEDVRARINVLSEIPKEWEERVKAWREINRGRRRKRGSTAAPSRNDEYFFYQTITGAFPFDPEEQPAFVERMKEYAIKSIREAKVHTGWIKPDTAYEDGCTAFIENILKPSKENQFLEDFMPFQKKVAFYGILNSLSQTLIKISAPGAPDFYQGTELWDLSLVDPDNRRPVDFERRRAILREIKEHEHDPDFIAKLLAAPQDGKIKAFVIHHSLKVRNENEDHFTRAGYLPLKTEGRHREHIVAFGRMSEDGWTVSIVPRFCTALVKEEDYPVGEEIWKDTCVILPEEAPSQWKDGLTGQALKTTGKIPAGMALKIFPAAFLVSRTAT